MKDEKLDAWLIAFKAENELTNDVLSAIFGITWKKNNSAYYRHLRTLRNIVEAKFIAPVIEE